MNGEDLFKITNNKNNSGGILKYTLVSLVLLAKIFAFMHINQHIPPDQSNTSNNESSVSETVDTPADKTVDTPANKIVDTPADKTNDTSASKSFHAWFYSHTGWGHVIIDVAIYLFLAVMFGIVSCKLICSLFPIRDANKKMVSRKSETKNR